MSAGEEVEYLSESLAHARRNMRGRWATDVAIAISFVPFLGWLFVVAWFVTFIVLVDVVGPRIERPPTAAQSRRRWARRATVYVGAKHMLLGAVPFAAGLVGGLWGLVGGAFLLLCIVSLATSIARRSTAAYYAAILPLATYLVVLAGWSFTLSDGPAGPIVLCLSIAGLLMHTHQISAANRRTAIELVEARAAAERSTTAKSAFVAMVSHELRTPLSGILAGAAELANWAPDATSRNNAALITDAAQMMRLLLNELLDLSKIEAGRMGVETVPFDLRETLLETVRFWRPELRRKQLYLKLEGSHRLPRWVEGDPTRLRQILNNLLSNSTKFTDAGGLTLRFRAQELDGAIVISIDVEDTGPGMTPEQTALLFSAFEQLSASTARAHGGTGLGLHISRELARLLGGDITVSSEPGVGSTFHVELRLAACEAPAATEPTVASAGSGLRILIVDDHQVNRLAFSLMLQSIAAVVECAEGGEQALEYLAGQDFDLVLMDIHMPGMSGLEVTRRLRSTPGPNRNKPVIALTGSVSMDQVDAYLAGGMDAFVMKPVTPTELLAAIDQILAERPGRPSREHSAAAA